MKNDDPIIVSTYSVVTEDGQTLITTKDFFKAIELVKKQPPGARMVRDVDGVVLAYTSGYKMPKEVKGFF